MKPEITQCRLCPQKFEEALAEPVDQDEVSPLFSGHPLEEGCPWCPECRARVFAEADRLLELVFGQAEAQRAGAST